MASPTPPAPESVWPEGLSLARAGLLIEREKIDEAALQRAVKDLPRLRHGPYSPSFSVPFVDRSDRPGVMVRLSVKPEEDVGFVFEISMRPSRALQPGLATLDELTEVLTAAIPSGVAEYRGTLDGAFQVAAQRWESIITLPIALPASGPSMAAGAPVVSGLEFTFHDESFPVRIASISRDESDHYFAQIVTEFPFAPLDSLVPRALDTLRRHMSLVLVPLPTSTPSIAP